MKRKILFILILVAPAILICQTQTVGIFLNEEQSFNGYTLIVPASNNFTYLIDNCGYEVHRWESEYIPGLSGYLLEDGSLLRTTRHSSVFFKGGGIGGGVERMNWEGDLLWSFEYHKDTLYHQHHDVELLPNGNVLVLAWEYKPMDEAIEHGRDPNLFGNEKSLWPEHIIEVEPIGEDSGNIVWEWHLWDHVIQDYDSTKTNFGTVKDHPELIDINFIKESEGPNEIVGDWIHANAIDYNPSLDQIMITSRYLNEFWIIDHSTTSLEAASHTGGNSGKGGDLLYRWGNPQTYRRGTAGAQKFFGPHDAHWIPEGHPDEGKVLIFNNGVQRPGGPYSSVEVISPPMNSDGTYVIEENEPFGPDTLHWDYFNTMSASSFFSKHLSGSQRLENGNTLICEGASGKVFEVDIEGNIIWQYINPIAFNGPLSQGGLAIGNSLFRAYRYSPNYPGLQGKTLSPGEPLEADPEVIVCELFSSNQGVKDKQKIEIQVYPTLAKTAIVINLQKEQGAFLSLYNSDGRRVHDQVLEGQLNTVNITNFAAGIYFGKIQSAMGVDHDFKIVKIH